MQAEPWFLNAMVNTIMAGRFLKKLFYSSFNKLPVHNTKQYLDVRFNERIQYELGELQQPSGDTCWIFQDTELDVDVACNGKLILVRAKL